MEMADFERTLREAIQQHFPRGNTTITITRTFTLNCRVEIDADTLLAVYFNALTEKTSYALIWHSQRVAGYDNYRFWHYHPPDNEQEHWPCIAPTPDSALKTLRDVFDTFKLAP